MTGKDSTGDRIQDYLSGELDENEAHRLERDLLAERHLALLGAERPPGDPAERRKLLERHVAELEGRLGEPHEGLAEFSPDELEERALAAEAELLDAYVQGRLGQADRAWIETLAGASARIRERLANARALRDEAAQVPTIRRPMWKVAGIAAAVLLTSLWIGQQWIEPPRGHGGIVQVLALEPAVTRGNDDIEMYEIGSHADAVQFELSIPSHPRFTAFEVVLKDPEGKVIDRQTGLSRNADRGVLVWQVSTDAIAATREKTYTIEYRGHSAGEAPVRLGTFQFDLYQVRPD